ncbi:hypothetical protein BD414DRAFT_541273 [Trametes punicea]|nr:hypothetical protein BD414DRAFT_541273 [Trametes punicea]
MDSEPRPIDTRQWRKRDQNIKIDKFTTTALIVPLQYHPEHPTRRLLHWRCGGAYIEGERGRSVAYDTQKLSVTDPLIQVHKDYMMSSAAPYHWETSLAKNFTTTDVYNLLVAKNFNRYLFNGAGSGCLTWVTALVNLLETEGVLPAGSVQSFLKIVEKARADPNYWVPDELGAQFY